MTLVEVKGSGVGYKGRMDGARDLLPGNIFKFTSLLPYLKPAGRGKKEVVPPRGRSGCNKIGAPSFRAGRKVEGLHFYGC